jgi:hypothetical protein
VLLAAGRHRQLRRAATCQPQVGPGTLHPASKLQGPDQEDEPQPQLSPHKFEAQDAPSRPPNSGRSLPPGASWPRSDASFPLLN